MQTDVNLEHLLDRTNFAHSERDPTSMNPLIQGLRPFYYTWRVNEGMDIVQFTDSLKVDTARLYRYSRKQIFSGVDLVNDKPRYTGNVVVRILERYAKELERSRSGSNFIEGFD